MVKTAVARRYAKALFELIEEAAIDTVRVGLKGIAGAVSESSALKHVLASPAFGFDEKRGILATLSERLQCPPILSDFLAQLVKKNRVGFLPEIAEEFADLADRGKGIKQVTVGSAKPLNAAEQDRLRSRLRELLQREVDITFHADAKLLAGLQIQIGSMVFDSTVKSRLASMRTLVTKE